MPGGRPKGKRRARGEHDVQSSFITWCRYNSVNYPELKLLYAIPNGALFAKSRHEEGTRLQKLMAEGFKAGVLDVHLPVPRGPFNGLWIEFKYGQNTLSKNQVAFAMSLVEQGHLVAVCRFWDEAVELVLGYLALPQRSLLRVGIIEESHKTAMRYIARLASKSLTELQVQQLSEGACGIVRGPEGLYLLDELRRDPEKAHQESD